ncbi:hypothetical protein L2W58_08420 [Dethiosulfovibrio sp. F2B]|nr:hypothetical protein [Dethiosulfovibrio faecalis]MCF4151826.1 hypothetical protein [Dethiosulfovibrio faecalis]
MDAKLVSISGVPYWRMPEGKFVEARGNEIPWAILIKTPEGTRPLRR